MMSSGRDGLHQFLCHYCNRSLSSKSTLQRHMKTCQLKNVSLQEDPGRTTPDTKNFMLPPIPSQLTVIFHQEKKNSRHEEPQITLKKILGPGSKDSSSSQEGEELLNQNWQTPTMSGSIGGCNVSKQTLHHCPFCEETFSSFSHCQAHIMNLHKNECDTELVERTCSVCRMVFSNKEETREHVLTNHGDVKPVSQKNSSSSDGCSTLAEEDFTPNQPKEEFNSSGDSFVDCQLAVIKTEPEDLDSSPEMDLVQNEDLRDFQLDIASNLSSRGTLMEETSNSLLTSSEHGQSETCTNAATAHGPSVQPSHVSCDEASSVSSRFTDVGTVPLKKEDANSVQLSQITCSEPGSISDRFTDVGSVPIKKEPGTVGICQTYNKPLVVHLLSHEGPAPEVNHEVKSASYTSPENKAATISHENGQFIQETGGIAKSLSSGQVVSCPLKRVSSSQGVVAMSVHSLNNAPTEPVFSGPDNHGQQSAQSFLCFTSKELGQVPSSKSQDTTTPGPSPKSKPVPKKPLLTCEVCSKTYRCRSSFKKHVNAHVAASSLVCKYCGQTFQQKDVFFTHMRLHEQNALTQPQGGALNLPPGGPNESNFQTSLPSGQTGSFTWDTKQVKPGIEGSNNILTQFSIPLSTMHLSEDQIPVGTKEKQKQVRKRKMKQDCQVESDWMGSPNYKRLGPNSLNPWAQNQFSSERDIDGVVASREVWNSVKFKDLKAFAGHQRLGSRIKTSVNHFGTKKGERNVPPELKSIQSAIVLKKDIDLDQPSVLKTNKVSKCLICRICCRTFSKIENYVRHRKLHEYRCLAYSCQYCGQFFGKVDLLDLHERRHHELMGGTQTYCCVYCDLFLRDKSILKQHVSETHRGFRVLLSSTRKPDLGLSKTFWNLPKKLATLKHNMNELSCAIETSVLQDILNKRTRQCYHCLKRFRNEEAMSRHVCVKPPSLQQHSQGNFYCDVCQQFFASPDQLEKHIEFQHIKVELYRCEVCGVWGRKEEIEHHMLSHMSKMGSFISTEQNNAHVASNFLPPAANSTKSSKPTFTSSGKKRCSGVFQEKEQQECYLNVSSTPKKGKAKVKHSQAIKKGKLHEEFLHHTDCSQEPDVNPVIPYRTNLNQTLQKKLLINNNPRQLVEDTQSKSRIRLLNNNKNILGTVSQKNILLENYLTSHQNELSGKCRITGVQNKDAKREVLPNLSGQIEIVEVNKFNERARLATIDKQKEGINKNRLNSNPSETTSKGNLPTHNNQSNRTGSFIYNNSGENPEENQQSEGVEKNRLSCQNVQNDKNRNEHSDRSLTNENIDRSRSSNFCNPNENPDDSQDDALLKSSKQSENMDRTKVHNPHTHSELVNRSRTSSLSNQNEQLDKNNLSKSLNQHDKMEKNRLSTINSEIEIFDVSKLEKRGSHVGILEMSRLPGKVSQVENSCPSSGSSHSDNSDKKINNQDETVDISQLPNAARNDSNKLTYHNKNDTRRLSNQGENMDRSAEYCIACEMFIPSHLFQNHLLKKHLDGGERSDFLFDFQSLPDNEWATEEDLEQYDDLGLDDDFEDNLENYDTALQTESTNEIREHVIYSENKQE
ncbi:uncharacterized protein LOC106470414 [Limulus polyphemus]|uniref:Uncharacterized protein LOC106470414 n=1 Tax=Limulus polyphemus TaxID=6850 RepID=A0ABM1BPZ8_LIMPO|nr:uncharacterized protein LOC106470414 [Limulus polyphemus]